MWPSRLSHLVPRPRRPLHWRKCFNTSGVGKILTELRQHLPIPRFHPRGILTFVQRERVMDKSHRELDVSGRNQPVRVVIAYHDLAAGLQAMRVLAGLARGFGEDLEFEPLPWSFDLLDDQNWSEVAASDVIQADILIIATSGPRPLPPAVVQWAEAAIRQKQGTAAAVVALFSSEEKDNEPGSSRFAAIQAAARQAGLAFFTPTPHHEVNEAIARVHQRAEMITPVLEKFFQPQLTEPRWEQTTRPS